MVKITAFSLRIIFFVCSWATAIFIYSDLYSASGLLFVIHDAFGKCQSTTMFMYYNVHVRQCSFTTMFIYDNVHLRQCSRTTMFTYDNVHARQCSRTTIVHVLQCSRTIMFTYDNVHVRQFSRTTMFTYDNFVMCGNRIHFCTSHKCSDISKLHTIDMVNIL